MEIKTEFEVGDKFWLLNDFYYSRRTSEPTYYQEAPISERLTYWGIIGEVTVIGIKPEIGKDSYKEELILHVETKLGRITYHNFKRFGDLFPTKEEAEAECESRNENEK